MPWWFWIVLWTVLVVSSLCLLAWLLYRAFRKALGALDAAQDWESSITDALGQANHAQPLREEPQPALFIPVGTAYADYIQGKNTRTLDRARRRSQRRDELGQPQLVGDLKRLQER
ncbi:hypothetical protein [Rothia nasimurium]|uniref:hypothetical protein n=1 Tax=Rothia nasimurium TaxID=85336 RepID=UPI001F24A77A|nr:hypothetical protein [Rothia nasimurium]